MVALVLDASQCADTDAGRFTVTQQVGQLADEQTPTHNTPLSLFASHDLRASTQ